MWTSVENKQKPPNAPESDKRSFPTVLRKPDLPGHRTEKLNLQKATKSILSLKPHFKAMRRNHFQTVRLSVGYSETRERSRANTHTTRRRVRFRRRTMVRELDKRMSLWLTIHIWLWVSNYRLCAIVMSCFLFVLIKECADSASSEVVSPLQNKIPETASN
jgi:hypothetical protein